eukprot:tig00020734_g13599.t1
MRRLPETRGSLHGETVAFCTLAQLCLEGDEAEARRAALFCAAVGLPVTLDALGVDPGDEAGLLGACRRAAGPGTTAANMPRPPDEHAVLRAALRAHEIGGEVAASIATSKA